MKLLQTETFNDLTISTHTCNHGQIVCRKPVPTIAAAAVRFLVLSQLFDVLKKIFQLRPLIFQLLFQLRKVYFNAPKIRFYNQFKAIWQLTVRFAVDYQMVLVLSLKLLFRRPIAIELGFFVINRFFIFLKLDKQSSVFCRNYRISGTFFIAVKRCYNKLPFIRHINYELVFYGLLPPLHLPLSSCASPSSKFL